MLAHGIANVIVCDRGGTIYAGRRGLTAVKEALASRTNPNRERATAAEALAGADVFVGLSGPGAVPPEAVRSMNAGAIVFALANPDPEVQPEAVRDFVAIMATGRSDYPNQINNVLAFPGVFRGALDVRASTINEEMKLAAAQAIAGVISMDELNPEYIIPSVFNRAISTAVAGAVARAAVSSGVARTGSATAGAT
jgi:malate dehydrogenase (oxaloacetate-decarboxylating)